MKAKTRMNCLIVRVELRLMAIEVLEKPEAGFVGFKIKSSMIKELQKDLMDIKT